MKTARQGYLYPLTALTASALVLTLVLRAPAPAVGQEVNEPQQELQLLLQLQQKERQDAQQRHQRERDAIIGQINAEASAQPVDQAAIQELHNQLEGLHADQQSENSDLQEAHQLAQEDSRLEIQRANGRPLAAEPDADFATLIHPVVGFTQVDANGIAVGGEALVLFFGDRIDVEVATGGFEDNSSITGIEIRNAITGDVYLNLNPNELILPALPGIFIEPALLEVEVGPPAATPDLALHAINIQAPAGLKETLEAGEGEIAISVNGQESLVGTFMIGMAFEAL